MVKATVRKPAPAVPATATAAPVKLSPKEKAGAIDVEATTSTVDTQSAEALADQLEAGAPVPGSDAEVEQSTAVAERPARTPGPVRALAQQDGSGLEGEWTSNDLKLPQLKIVNGSGELSQKFNQGSLLYADEKIWGAPNLEPGAKNPSMLFVPVTIKKQLRENLSQDEVLEGVMPRVVNSVAEADALTGEGSTQWVGNQKPRWSPSARCVFLIQAPEGCEENPNFPESLDGKQWALAVFYAGGMAYNESAKQIFNAAQISLKENGKIVLHKKVWTFEVVKKAGGKFTVFVPKLRLTKDETGPEVRALCQQVNGVKNIEGKE